MIIIVIVQHLHYYLLIYIKRNNTNYYILFTLYYLINYIFSIFIFDKILKWNQRGTLQHYTFRYK